MFVKELYVSRVGTKSQRKINGNKIETEVISQVLVELNGK